jgi:hypothetical protein
MARKGVEERRGGSTWHVREWRRDVVWVHGT